ncbi:hypothetical protein Pla86_31490 [Planctomycetes bacterium Pla86]|uniref:Uncharacterized protein n=1 Tax=Engelhardtia mirabilis TaxID=2528011 RepID=A0A518BM48_9BACT|nr:hypothetical protein Pla133_31500 [Planctomycetes bacterium Pla133]QDV02384.1 hypothetical protein Pla86_31490 [Planctomycetes bacterium Pla86]
MIASHSTEQAVVHEDAQDDARLDRSPRAGMARGHDRGELVEVKADECLAADEGHGRVLLPKEINTRNSELEQGKRRIQPNPACAVRHSPFRQRRRPVPGRVRPWALPDHRRAIARLNSRKELRHGSVSPLPIDRPASVAEVERRHLVDFAVVRACQAPRWPRTPQAGVAPPQLPTAQGRWLHLQASAALRLLPTRAHPGYQKGLRDTGAEGRERVPVNSAVLGDPYLGRGRLVRVSGQRLPQHAALDAEPEQLLEEGHGDPVVPSNPPRGRAEDGVPTSTASSPSISSMHRGIPDLWCSHGHARSGHTSTKGTPHLPRRPLNASSDASSSTGTSARSTATRCLHSPRLESLPTRRAIWPTTSGSCASTWECGRTTGTTQGPPILDASPGPRRRGRSSGVPPWLHRGLPGHPEGRPRRARRHLEDWELDYRRGNSG